MKHRILCLIIVLCMCTATVTAQEIEVVEPASVGMSSQQLGHIEKLIQRYMDEKTIPGAVVLVARHGKIAYLEAFGKADEERPLQTDAIFRLASLSKPIVGGSGILQLMDQGEVMLSEPVYLYLPEFKGQKVAEFDEQGTMTLVAAERPMTIHDLLTFTSGFPGIWYDHPLKEMYDEALPRGWRHGKTLRKFAAIAGRLPLLHQPGAVWSYGNDLEILGAIVEEVSGKRVDRYYEEHLFAPLKMTDTAFYPPEVKWPRVTGYYYATDGQHGKKGDPFVEDISVAGWIDRVDFSFDKDPAWFSLSGGLHSTACDVFRYFQMLLNGGELDGVRVLSKHAVKMMLQNQIGERRETQYGHGWGYSVGVQVEDSPRPIIGKTYGGKGAFSWDGYFGPSAFGNPNNDTVIVIMTHIWTVAEIWELQARIVNVVNRAIVD